MKQTVQTLQAMKERGEKIAMLTCYDYTMAKLMDAAGTDMLLVGDSLGNVILGYSDTISVTMEDMIHHTAAVSRGAQMPWSLQICRSCPIRLRCMTQLSMPDG